MLFVRVVIGCSKALLSDRASTRGAHRATQLKPCRALVGWKKFSPDAHQESVLVPELYRTDSVALRPKQDPCALLELRRIVDGYAVQANGVPVLIE
jgi:hypothetical protein